MQPQANRERIIIRTSLSPKLPQVIADEHSIRQIVLSLLSNSIRLTGPAGQVIVSTATAEHGEVVLRVRDTGLRLSQVELGAVGELFRRPYGGRRRRGPHRPRPAAGQGPSGSKPRHLHDQEQPGRRREPGRGEVPDRARPRRIAWTAANFVTSSPWNR